MIALHSFGKRFCAIFFYFYAIFCRLDPLAWIVNLLKKVRFFDNFENVGHELNDKQVFKLKISVTKFCRF